MDDIYTPYRSADPNAPGFVAGLPSYPRNFSRDTLLAGLIAGNEELIVSQLNVSAAHQGTQLDPSHLLRMFTYISIENLLMII